MPLLNTYHYTTEDIYNLPDGQRAELIDGQIYDMAPPGFVHQKISFALARKIADHVDEKGGDCTTLPAPFAVFLSADNRTYVEPDISVICDKSKIDDRGCNGAPDWVIEIVSPSTQQKDYGIKLYKYRTCGVREYWIVNPMKKTINVFDFEHEKSSDVYSFEDNITVCIFPDLEIKLAELV